MSFKNATTTALSSNATAAEVQSALEALSTVGAGAVSVSESKHGNESGSVLSSTGGGPANGGRTWRVT
eukprot:CAMPEP_0171780302 /NCGR_PEP_ID=MMETSP0991-20121206/59532_1 /TAXON_ID=483369 /ORGANISM="non described non described, Strain CCMP2098" /LENGTH=67 /DNA_ID=CAMNT_0012387653 /DNA_START=36 /DNA_END=235 /DNA_ORIENTATION=+